MEIQDIIQKVQDEAACLDHKELLDHSCSSGVTHCRETSMINPDKSLYHIHEFVALAPEELVTNAYKCLLKREPDPAANQYVSRLESGEISTVRFLAALRLSPEGKEQKVRINGLYLRLFYHYIQRIPVLGRVADTVVALIGLAGIKKHLIELSHQQHTIIAILESKAERHELESKAERHELESKAERHELESKAERHELESKAERHELESKAERHELQAYAQGVHYAERYLHHINQELKNLLEEIANPDTKDKQTIISGLNKIRSSCFDKLYLDFEYRYRGTPSQVLKSLHPYAQLISEKVDSLDAKALDLGCGRGEMVQFLQKKGFDATGVDLNALAVEEAAAQNLDAVQADALEYLQGMEGDSVSLVSALHLVEHLPHADLLELLQQILRVLAPGGMILLETPNPRNLLVGSGEFYRDFTHNRPIFPDTLGFILDYFGYAEVQVYYFTASDTTNERELQKAQEHKFDNLNDYIDISRDYVVVGQKPCE
jgi:O-antigen chain-terminating methyltransferase